MPNIYRKTEPARSLIDHALAEMMVADFAVAVEGGTSLMALIGEGMLHRMGYPVTGKADVKIEVDEATRITITWAGA